MASLTAEKTSAKTNLDTDFCISARFAAESTSEECLSNESLTAVGIVDGSPTSKVDVRIAISAVGDPAIDAVWRRRDVADKLTLDDEDPKRVVK